MFIALPRCLTTSLTSVLPRAFPLPVSMAACWPTVHLAVHRYRAHSTPRVRPVSSFCLVPTRHSASRSTMARCVFTPAMRWKTWLSSMAVPVVSSPRTLSAASWSVSLPMLWSSPPVVMAIPISCQPTLWAATVRLPWLAIARAHILPIPLMCKFTPHVSLFTATSSRS